MGLPHLPPEWVSLLDDLAYDGYREELRQPIQQIAEDVSAWHHFESAYWLDDQEAQQLDNLQFLITEIEHRLGSDQAAPDLDFLAPRLVQCVKLMEDIREGRQRSHYTEHSVVDELLVACAAWVSGQAQERAVHERLPKVEVWQSGLREGYEAFRSGLPEQAQRDLEMAFGLFEESMKQLADCHRLSDKQELKPAMASLVDATSLLDFLVDLHRRQSRQLEERYSRWSAIPHVGSRLELALERLTALSSEASNDYWHQQIHPLFLELSCWWGQYQDLLPLPSEWMESWTAEVDQDLDRLLQVEPAHWVEDNGLEELDEILDRLHSGFAESQSRLFPVQHLQGGAAGALFELIQGLLRGMIPVAAVPDVLDSQSVPESWQDIVAEVLHYTREGDRCRLYRARERLLQQVPPPSFEEAQPWECPTCQQLNVPESSTCSNCRGIAGLGKTLRSWNA